MDEIPQASLNEDLLAATLACQLSGAPPGSARDGEGSHEPRHIVEVGKCLIHQVEVDLSKSERINPFEPRRRCRNGHRARVGDRPSFDKPFRAEEVVTVLAGLIARL